jgi:hypothetical protein
MSTMGHESLGVERYAYLEHDDTSTLPNHEASPISIKRPTCFKWLVIPVCRQTPSSRKSSDSQGMDTGLGAASYHDICITKLYKTRRVSDAVCSSRTSGSRRMIWSL